MVHRTLEPRATHAAHSAGVAMTMSTPSPLSGDAADSTSSGVADDRLYAGGKVTSCASTDALADAVDDALHGTLPAASVHADAPADDTEP